MKNYMTAGELASLLSTYEPSTLVLVPGLGDGFYSASVCEKTVIYNEDFENFVLSFCDEKGAFGVIVIE